MELDGRDIVFYGVGVNSRCNFFMRLLFHFLCQGIIVELDYYFVILIIEK